MPEDIRVTPNPYPATPGYLPYFPSVYMPALQEGQRLVCERVGPNQVHWYIITNRQDYNPNYS